MAPRAVPWSAGLLGVTCVTLGKSLMSSEASVSFWGQLPGIAVLTTRGEGCVCSVACGAA